MTPTPRPLPTAVEHVARAVVAEALTPTGRALDVRVLHSTPVSVVLKVRIGAAEPTCVLKLVRGEERPATDLGRTAAVMACAAAAGVPVPRVLDADGTARIDGWQYLLQEHVEGSSWYEVRPTLDGADLDLAHAAIATVAVSLQTIHLNGYGELDESMTASEDDLVSALRRRARLRTMPGPALETAEALLDRATALLGSPPPTLSHDDLHHRNLVFGRTKEGWRLRAVLDWDKAWAGPAEADLARLSFWDDMTGPGFWSVYRKMVGVRPGEAERLPVHQLLWCLEHPSATTRHREDTARLCRHFGLRPPR